MPVQKSLETYWMHHLHSCIYTHTHTHTHICIYIYIYIYIYVHYGDARGIMVTTVVNRHSDPWHQTTSSAFLNRYCLGGKLLKMTALWRKEIMSYGYVTRSSDLIKTILQRTVLEEGADRRRDEKITAGYGLACLSTNRRGLLTKLCNKYSATKELFLKQKRI